MQFAYQNNKYLTSASYVVREWRHSIALSIQIIINHLNISLYKLIVFIYLYYVVYGNYKVQILVLEY